VVQKGTDPRIDSYSGFFDNNHRKQTELAEVLRKYGVQSIYLMGLDTDYCVKFTALDARQLGFSTNFVIDGCRAINLRPGDERRAIEEMTQTGVNVIASADLL
jgi:nicotinamidase/pyrazinamidase